MSDVASVPDSPLATGTASPGPGAAGLDPGEANDRKEAMVRLSLVLIIITGVFVALSGNALAGETRGASVSMCAQMHLGQRDNPPAITCSHDGTAVTFATFGDMVRHMRAGC